MTLRIPARATSLSPATVCSLMMLTKAERTATAATRKMTAKATKYDRSSRRSSTRVAEEPRSRIQLCKAVAYTVNVFDGVPQRTGDTELAPKIGDMSPNGISVALVAKVSDLFAQHLVTEHL